MSTALFDPIKTMSKVTDTALVAFSGGKDSIVTLDLAVRYMKNVKAFFKYLVPGLECEERTLRWYENHYDIEIIRIPDEHLCEVFRYGVWTGEDPDFPIVSQTDVHNYCKVKTDNYFVMTGERANESLQRRGLIAECGSINLKYGRMYPVAYWKPSEITEYIKYHKLYLPRSYKDMNRSLTAIGDVGYIKEHYPSDYDKICNLFPFIGSIIKKDEINGEK